MILEAYLPKSSQQTTVLVRTPENDVDWMQTRGIFIEYASTLKVDLSFQDFDKELAHLPGEYIEPRGCLLLAWVGDSLAGCCALRPLDTTDYANAAEMKRLFVRTRYR